MRAINFNKILIPKGENKQPVMGYLGQTGLIIPEVPKECLHYHGARR